MTRRLVQAAVVGTTSWGTTLAIHLAKLGHPVALWARTPEEAEQLRQDGENRRFLPGFPFPPSLRVTASLSDAFGEATLVVIVVPSKSIRQNAQRVREVLRPDAIIVSATKGLEMSTGGRMTQVLREEMPAPLWGRICALSGPNLSAEVARGLPTSTVIACQDEAVAREVQAEFMSPQLRVYTNVDVIGVELAGALKNVIALGTGIGDGLGYGNNSKAAFITRGLAEIARLGVAAGANPLTFAGLAGLGDLVATAASPLSRNRYVGEQLAKGRGLGEILTGMRNVAEGVDTTAAAMRLSRELRVDMPITRAAYGVLFEGLKPQDAVAALMERAPQPEWMGIVASGEGQSWIR
ncbi:MAG: NAD(P)-dependent glycerol-3-phosphate dehydrogenase [Chloroflexi bacterium]|nr:NAD(P)-dependent glycerol-3-phosphate dehydrogenase [Chloroflexota bacterium]